MSPRDRNAHTHRSASEAAEKSAPCAPSARYAQHWNFVGGPPEQFARKRDLLGTYCAEVGPDPGDIALSAQVRLNPQRDDHRVVAEAAALAEEGLDLAIIYLSPPYDPAVLQPLAEAITASGLAIATGAAPEPDEACLWLRGLRGSGRRGETVTGSTGPVYEPPMRLVGRNRPPVRSEPIMTVARSVADVLSEHVVVQVDCIDRMYCNVYVPGLQYPEGLVGMCIGS